jgi:hypothetical protein
MVDDSGFPLGPQSGVTYPIQVLYCGNCSLPIEVSTIAKLYKFSLRVCTYRITYVWLFQYCEYYPEYEKCKLWLERNMPTEFERVVKLGKYVYLPLLTWL